MDSINIIAKASLLSTLLMGSAALYATKPITNVNTAPNQNQTEIISEEGAEAINVASLQSIQQSSASVPHNIQLDRTLRKFIETEDDRRGINDLINNVYDVQGEFLGSALMQHEIDRRALYHFMTGNTKILKTSGINPNLAEKIEGFGPDFYKTIKPKCEMVLDWMFKDYTKALMSNFGFGYKPKAEETIDRLDEIATKKTGFDLDERIEYFTYSNGYKSKVLEGKTDNQSMAKLAAYKMFLIDKLMFIKELDGVSVLYGEGHFPKLIDYFKEWMESVNPCPTKF